MLQTEGTHCDFSGGECAQTFTVSDFAPTKELALPWTVEVFRLPAFEQRIASA